MSYYTHRVAVNAYLIYEEKFLLLKRKAKPQIWVPPGGRLRSNEHPLEGLKREVFEETSLNIKVHMPVTTWYGEFNGPHILSIDYLCTSQNDHIMISLEHSEFSWMTIKELEKRAEELLVFPKGFHLSDFQLTWQLYEKFGDNLPELI